MSYPCIRLLAVVMDDQNLLLPLNFEDRAIRFDGLLGIVLIPRFNLAPKGEPREGPR